jgi:hypothetical protein
MDSNKFEFISIFLKNHLHEFSVFTPGNIIEAIIQVVALENFYGALQLIIRYPVDDFF